MKVMEAIHRIDQLKHNTYDTRQKLMWLSQLDGMVVRQLLGAYQPELQCPVYDPDTPADRALLVPAPYDEIYLLWLEGRMDYYSGEYTRFNNAMAAFAATYQAYCDHYARTHRRDGGNFC